MGQIIGRQMDNQMQEKNTIKGNHKLKFQNSMVEKRGMGEKIKNSFFLKSFESLYLLYIKKLKITRGKKQIDFNSYLEFCLKTDEEAFTKFLIYRDLKTRGYTVKDGFGFGSDFRVYERGKFGEKGSKYLIFAFKEGQQEKINKLKISIEEITKMGKEPIIAVTDRRGEVIYYKISKINFSENKFQNLDSLFN